MTGETATLVLKDASGTYYLLPQAMIESCRVPAERAAEVDTLLRDIDDVAGHIAMKCTVTPLPFTNLQLVVWSYPGNESRGWLYVT